ncbi:unnamed protein product [Phytomonas sp. EM1]|nr:unnamed protein product [Phytomonas sp. EM1]|eukprot:CCW60631.1 unnamed protein product [Phytomonas sp. isolate EM1]
MAGIKNYLFYIGVLILAHAVYTAITTREQLQAWHHGRVNPSVRSFNVIPAVSTPVLLFIVSTEAIIGMLIAMTGFVCRSTLREALLTELTQYYRYDRNMYTGIGFIHFNHRGTIGAGRKEAGEDVEGVETSTITAAGGCKSENEKKKD